MLATIYTCLWSLFHFNWKHSLCRKLIISDILVNISVICLRNHSRDVFRSDKVLFLLWKERKRCSFGIFWEFRRQNRGVSTQITEICLLCYLNLFITTANAVLFIQTAEVSINTWVPFVKWLLITVLGVFSLKCMISITFTSLTVSPHINSAQHPARAAG